MIEYIERNKVLEILSGKNAAWNGYQKVKDLPFILVGYVPKTNADRIRSMTNEELAELIYNFDSLWEKFCVTDAEVIRENLCPIEDCRICIKNWLEEEAKE